MLDVRWDMFMVREGAGQRVIIGMRLGIIPVQPLPSLFDGIAVCLDDPLCKVQVFLHTQYDIIGEFQTAAEFCEGWPMPDHNESRAFNRGVDFLERIDQAFVVRQGRKHQPN